MVSGLALSPVCVCWVCPFVSRAVALMCDDAPPQRGSKEITRLERRPSGARPRGGAGTWVWCGERIVFTVGYVYIYGYLGEQVPYSGIQTPRLASSSRR